MLLLEQQAQALIKCELTTVSVCRNKSSVAQWQSIRVYNPARLRANPPFRRNLSRKSKKITENKNDISATRGTLVSKSTAPTFRAPKGRGCSRSRIRPRSAHVGLYTCVVAKPAYKMQSHRIFVLCLHQNIFSNIL